MELSKNRAFLYGDGVFESMLLLNKKIPLFPLHVKRLHKALNALDISVTERVEALQLKQEISKACKKLGNIENAAVRVTAYRDSEGSYLPSQNGVEVHIKIRALKEESLFNFTPDIHIGTFSEYRKNQNFLSKYKTCSSLLYVLAAKYAKNNGLDDALVMNLNGGLIESTNSNLYIVKGNMIFSPSLEEGPIDGIMRNVVNVVCTWLPYQSFFQRKAFSVQELLEADEIFLSNAVSGIRPVKSFKNKTYSTKVGVSVAQAIKEYLYSL